jgi:hypothetical protein
MPVHVVVVTRRFHFLTCAPSFVNVYLQLNLLVRFPWSAETTVVNMPVLVACEKAVVHLNCEKNPAEVAMCLFRDVRARVVSLLDVASLVFPVLFALHAEVYIVKVP